MNRVTLLCIGVLLSLPLAIQAAASDDSSREVSGVPPLEVSGFDWAENLDFDGQGNLFVSDSDRGEIWRIWLEGNEWSKELYFDDARAIGGLAIDSENIYATAVSESGEFQLLRIPLEQPGAEAEVMGTFPWALNGLEMDVDGLLYATTEGNFLPGTGSVFQIYPDGEWDYFVEGLWAADGIAIDTSARLMYVTQVVNNKVVIIRLPGGDVVKTLSVARPRDFSLLDDIALDAEGANLYGADFGRGEIMRIPLSGGTPTAIYSGLDAPTSLLFGEGPTFNSTSLYVTEGGGFIDEDQEQRVIEVGPVP